jgi:hypothetical protein
MITPKRIREINRIIDMRLPPDDPRMKAAEEDLREVLVAMVMADPDRWADTITEAAAKVGEFGNGEGGLASWRSWRRGESGLSRLRLLGPGLALGASVSSSVGSASGSSRSATGL